MNNLARAIALAAMTIIGQLETTDRSATLSPSLDASRVSLRGSPVGYVIRGRRGAASGVEVLVINRRTGESAEVSQTPHGGFLVQVSAEEGDRLTLFALDELGNRSAPTNLVVPIPPLPPDPATVAPPLDPTIPTDIASATEFLYTGPDSIQSGVVSGTMDPRRAVVLRGAVTDRQGAPIPGVEVEVVGHPEFGRTTSRADGHFDLVANGGETLTVEYEKPGFLPARRSVATGWREFVRCETVVLVPVDPVLTTIHASHASFQVARGSVSLDEEGARQATLLCRPNTEAALVFEDGSQEALSRLSIRATEYTVGDQGPAAMPASLPTESAYTYCVELSVDEAFAKDAVEVVFDKPMCFYLENFASFPVGAVIPLGHFDRPDNGWESSTSGRVIEVLEVVDGRVEVDMDGDGLAEDPVELATIGFSDEEREELARLYAVGDTLWRAEIPHFSPWDLNGAYPFLLPDETPDVDDISDPALVPNPCTVRGSIVECENQVLRKEVDLTGVPFPLIYSSERMPGYAVERTAKLRLTGETIAAEVLEILLEIDVAGRHFEYRFPPSPNLTTTFVWDGNDAYGRAMNGSTPLSYTVSYLQKRRVVVLVPDNLPLSVVNDLPLFGAYLASEWGYPFPEAVRGTPVTVVRVEDPQLPATVRSRSGSRSLGALRRSVFDLGGWSLPVHHVYDVDAQRLHLGTGEFRDSLGAANTVMKTLYPTLHFSQQSERISDLAFGPDGTLYWLLEEDGKLMRLLPGSDVAETVSSSLKEAFGLAVAPNGSRYVSHTHGIGSNREYRLTEIRPDGTRRVLTEVMSALLPGVAGQLAVAPNGDLLITRVDSVYRYVPETEQIQRIAGIPGTRGFAGDGGPANLALFDNTSDIDCDSAGNLYIYDAGSGGTGRIRRITPDGIITTVAGNGTGGALGDGGPATLASLGGTRMSVAKNGEIYLNEYEGGDHSIRLIGQDGVIRRIAGGGTLTRQPAFVVDDGPATAQKLYDPTLALSPDGILHVADRTQTGPHFATVRVVQQSLPSYSLDDIFVPSIDGAVLYRFDATGRHLETIDALNFVTRWTFGYDSMGRLSSIVDRDGNLTMIQRDGQGLPTAVVGPYGEQVGLHLGTDGYLEEIHNPGLSPLLFDYTPGGMMVSAVNEGGEGTQYAYDTIGLLESVTNPLQREKTLGRTLLTNGLDVVVTSPELRTMVRSVRELPEGGVQRINTSTDGTQDVATSDGVGQTITYANGLEISATQSGHPIYGMRSPISSERKLVFPSGLTTVVTESRSVTLADSSDPTSILSTTRSLSSNGKTVEGIYDAATRQLTVTTAEGRVLRSLQDAEGRTIEVSRGDLEPTRFLYDSQGRLEQIRRGVGAEERVVQFGYDSSGRLGSLTDPALRVTTTQYDSASRVSLVQYPGSTSVAVGYDAAGRMNSVTPPGAGAYVMSYDAAGQIQQLDPPGTGAGAGPVLLEHDADGNQTLIQRADGRTIQLIYDSGGRLGEVLFDGVSKVYGYAASGLMNTLASPEVSLSLEHDGPFLTREVYSGVISGSVERVYDAQLEVASIVVNGTHTIDRTVDADGLLTSAGPLSVQRRAETGSVEATSVGDLSTALSYSSFGEFESFSATHLGSPLWDTSIIRDKLGRVTDFQETVAGITDRYEYEYDLQGRLERVRKNGGLVEEYSYDLNGNRLTGSNHVGSLIGTYDGLDRLAQYGTNVYGYSPDGERTSLVDGSGTTSYEYSALGHLESVTLSDGARVDYVVGPFGRRIGKKVDGTLVQGFLYLNDSSPVAELDGAGNVTSVFVYGSKPMVPAVMIKAGIPYRILSDERGSPRFVVDAQTGIVAQRMDYDSFGNVLLDTNPGFQPFGFAGGIYDSDTGLVNFGVRDYDSMVGRWLTRDPGTFAGGTNLYAYVSNDPINLIDPSGGIPVIVGLAALAGTIAGVANALPGLLCGEPTIEVVRRYGEGGVGGIVGGLVFYGMARGGYPLWFAGVSGSTGAIATRSVVNGFEPIDLVDVVVEIGAGGIAGAKVPLAPGQRGPLPNTFARQSWKDFGKSTGMKNTKRMFQGDAYAGIAQGAASAFGTLSRNTDGPWCSPGEPTDPRTLPSNILSSW